MNWLKPKKLTGESPEPTETPSKEKSLLLRWMRWPHINVDLANPLQRLKFIFFLLGVVFVLVGMLVGGMAGYEYTESAEFCGTTCHSMDPQWTRYQASPHTNVLCAECHIGPGASFFVKSKIDGLRQVYAETFGTYHRPIKSPIHNLRPARDTCEGCHSPTTFKDNIVKTNLHFDNDRNNTPIMNTLVLKMGGWRETTGDSKGIHWHITSKVYYLAADEQRQVMLWVGVEQPDGSLKEFYSRDMIGMAQTNFVEKARENGEIRQMDCIDCHNRTAHDIPSPQKMVDQAIEDGLISRDLPYIRSKAVDLLSVTYADKDEAMSAIDALSDNYQANGIGKQLASLSLDNKKLQSAIDEIKRIYTITNFPDMNLNWQANPNNDRHTPSLGCFRCHDGNHINPKGDDETGNKELISVKCNLCHTVPIVGRGDEQIVEAPVIVGAMPESHSDFRWTIEHRNITEEQTKEECLNCHGQGFCNNSACHNLSHPEDMAFSHAKEVRKLGGQVCYTCHQNVTCTRCHPAGIINIP